MRLRRLDYQRLEDKPFHLDQFPDRFQVGIFFRDLAKRRIHFETGEQMDLGRFRVAEERIVATHVVVIDWLAQKCDRSFKKKSFGLEGFSELVQTEPSMKKSGAALRRGPAQFAADEESARPFFLPHQVVES